MPYVPYVTPDYYKETYKGSTVPEDELERTLRQASRHIDSLTYNRIVGRGFSNLAEFQQEVIREVVCLQADFEHENADEISTILSNYSLNGVSVTFGNSWNVFTDKGIAMMRDVYALLSQTGLCCRLAR
ncbi:hypothetical protein [Lacrimispora sp. 38-1]|uniref:hypothetical protein n=1 Tax=Lacrimispora sp. 38-1 TaxID=3125778 RepID=UPI003CF46162